MTEHPDPAPIRVAIVEDDDIQRHAGVDHEAQEGIRRQLPDVVLMDIGLGEMSGIQCVEQLRSEFPDLNIIMQTVYSDEEKIFESLRAGAIGYLLKKTST